MTIKINLEKAYDQVRWDFIDASLQATSILNYLRKVIISTISISTIQVLWNGVPMAKFRPARGIKQGCPLSPYLSVLCMEWLGHFIRSALSKGVWKPIRLSHSGPVFSHLFFVDDLVILCIADE
ncbi:hypothetical protein PVK06_034471 [Gossypium arboreum]|uniref:Reverse transcriptase domain-containing protein n=1 Tax=Gossypium arboreum TaxID=29729 RepID=A0ABR0NEB4_GOSAR|nr:hypothetical protein PVK06_034471 [Gossypium arboreum]